ncbi:putative membrane protein [Friedmanniella endophytica]|uniref:Putative membrane protein n=1 Tax=Microlunatus kandeliicorticis TaxID=1759536 RepID=A0A7W3ITL5_9ACTN|nr:hypothetical protein [Microlunatus kandeliicorticis]MBA8795024.1 putative membrane protein [Microlunatus kandeliicorticis]
MPERNTLVRSLHDVGLAAWFGGGLMGAVGLNGGTAEAHDSTERLRLSSVGWAKWTPWQIAAVAAHTVGGIGLLVANRKRVRSQRGAGTVTVVKLVLTAAAAAVTAYSGVLGAEVARHQEEGGEGATEPHADAPEALQASQRQLKALQWAIPALTGTCLVLGAVEGEQQRGPAGLLDLDKREVVRALRRATTSAG